MHMNKNVNCISNSPLTYDLRLYSRNDALSIFLGSLNSHRIGTAFLTRDIARRRTDKITTMLDVGCGEGTFTSLLFNQLNLTRLSTPRNLLAFDPDVENLEAYSSKLQSFKQTNLVVAHAPLEHMRFDGLYDLVVCSHSLYGMLENPSLSEVSKLGQIKRILDCVRPGGIAFLSLASRYSPSYQVKRSILAALGIPNTSIHSEDLSRYLVAAGLQVRPAERTSYIDVTNILGDSSAILKWCSFFCRVPEHQLLKLGVKFLRDAVRQFALQFASAPSRIKEDMRQFPSDVGPPNDATMLLIHSEQFYVAQRD